MANINVSTATLGSAAKKSPYDSDTKNIAKENAAIFAALSSPKSSSSVNSPTSTMIASTNPMPNLVLDPPTVQ